MILMVPERLLQKKNIWNKLKKKERKKLEELRREI